jgi:hypothetical protein
MKLINYLKIEELGLNIGNSSRNDLPDLFIDLGFKEGVELGTRNGDFALKICQAGLKLNCVDSWLDYPDYTSPDDNWQTQLNGQYEKTKKLLATFSANIIRKLSMDAVKDFKDESLDFIYIDANHDFKYVIEDIFEWSKKIRKGGVIAGHDYFQFDSREKFKNMRVKEAVDAYTNAYGITPWYIIGDKDKIKSFFWIKK